MEQYRGEQLYVPRPLGTKALQRLGSKIGSRVPLDQTEQKLYEDLIRDAGDRVAGTRPFVESFLAVARGTLPRMDAEVAGRVKTLSTLADKLERTPGEKLPSIHDVAGLRIVAPVTMLEQQIAVNSLRTHFDSHAFTSREALIIDRVASPSHGYRGIHLVVWPSGRPLEIQFRTSLQHGWAQLMEVFGDRWGREPRYGLPLRPVNTALDTSRRHQLGLMSELSEMIAAHEEASQMQALLHVEVPDDAYLQAGMTAERLAAIRVQAVEANDSVLDREVQLHRVMSSLRAEIESDESN